MEMKNLFEQATVEFEKYESEASLRDKQLDEYKDKIEKAINTDVEEFRDAIVAAVLYAKQRQKNSFGIVIMVSDTDRENDYSVHKMEDGYVGIRFGFTFVIPDRLIRALRRVLKYDDKEYDGKIEFVRSYALSDEVRYQFDVEIKS